MAEKKAPSGRKSTAAPRGKAASSDGQSKAPTPTDVEKPVEKPVEGARSPAKGAAAKTTGAQTADASKTSGPATASPDASASGARGTASSDKPASDKPASDKSVGEKNQSPEPTRTSIPASGAKSVTAMAPGPFSGPDPKGIDAAMAKVADAKKATATPAETKTTTTTGASAGTNDKSSTGPGTKPTAAKPAGDTSATAGTATTASARAAPSKTPPPTVPQQKARKGGFIALFLGGVCAAAIGFGAAYYVLPQMGIMSPNSTATDDVAAKLAEQSDRLTALDARIDALPGAPDTSGIEAGQADMVTQISDLSNKVSALTARLADIEAQPSGADGEGVSTAQLNELRRTLKAQGDQVARLVSDADQRDDAARASAQQDLRRAALTRISTALDTGTPFAPALGDLERAGMSAPDALQDVAEAGVPTQSALQQSFAPAARAALAKARKSGTEEGSDSFWSFMSGQLGARSLERREGPGTDAVLSRAEDDLRQGNLQAALTEVEALPDPARNALSEWAENVRTRMQAIAAYDALAAKLN
ncbi:hypothetical protein [Roseovarius sp. M141]|uniref:hypothetical protein n=1 Tax=Roseovarius sp. M141 TaxID=2583806 RepID=UPI0020CE04F2|nr:hypothetical protein [Roseovarius sp. M141]MCQ0091944.1 hypothetical protein [Roseovarius sp. M141]